MAATTATNAIPRTRTQGTALVALLYAVIVPKFFAMCSADRQVIASTVIVGLYADELQNVYAPITARIGASWDADDGRVGVAGHHLSPSRRRRAGARWGRAASVA